MHGTFPVRPVVARLVPGTNLAPWEAVGIGVGARASRSEAMHSPGCILNPVSSSLLDRITIEPGKCGGRPCIRGTRMRVSDLLELLANGATIEEIVGDYPSLERDDVLAAIAYAAVQTNHAVVRVA